METRQALVVDAFADEPMGGLAVAVVPDGSDLSQVQCERIATELGAAGVVTEREDGLAFAAGSAEATEAFVEAAVAGAGSLFERDRLDGGTHTLQAGTERAFEVREDGTVRVELPPRTVEDAAASADELASALGVDPAALRDVGADLPPVRASGAGNTLVVAVNFLEHLGGAAPDARAVTSLLETAEAARLVAFTFDTLGSGTDLHARVFARDGERPASGVGVAGCAAALSAHGVFDGDAEEVRAECGHFLDRPATVAATLEPGPRVGGGAVTVLDGELVVPADDADDIIEA